VTGAAQGLGAVYAKALAAEGARLVVSDVIDCRPVVDAITAGGGEAIAQICDVTDNTALARSVAGAEAAFGPIEILIPNAALFVALRRRPFEEIDEDEWDTVMRVNVRGTFQTIKAVVPSMRRCGRGKIINVSSGTVLAGAPQFLHYVTSKGAIMAMTRSLSRELGADNICVNSIAPGLTESEGLADHPDYDQAREMNRNLRIFQRDMVPDDLIGTVLYLASPDSDFITGQMINVDGGRSHY
jgi:NAD(P)-dependent dehydrogenase (short-subunit alcohol dehydrogenase family)